MTVKKLEYNDNASRINNVNNSKTENKHYDANKTYILCRKAREKQHYSELIFDSAIVSESMCFLSSRDLHRHTNKVSSSQKTTILRHIGLNIPPALGRSAKSPNYTRQFNVTSSCFSHIFKVLFQ